MKKRTSGIDKYSTFGLREVWLEEFFDFGDEWISNSSLSPRQMAAMINWLIESELIDPRTKRTTELFDELRVIYEEDPFFVWGIIWINLYYNSIIIKWYCDSIKWGVKVSKEDLLEILMVSFPDLSKGTLYNAINAMINMFDNSSLNESFSLGLLEKKGRAVKSIYKKGVDDELDSLLVAYSLYKVKQHKARVDFSVSELYDVNFEGGPYKLFGISQSGLERKLRGLKYFNNVNIIDAEGGSRLNEIFLNEKLSSYDLIKFKKEMF